MLQREAQHASNYDVSCLQRELSVGWVG